MMVLLSIIITIGIVAQKGERGSEDVSQFG